MKMFVWIPHLPLNISLRDSQSDVFSRRKEKKKSAEQPVSHKIYITLPLREMFL